MDDVAHIKGRGAPQQAFTSMSEVKSFYAKEIETNFPDLEVPAIFGQHVNAEISSQIADALQLLESVVSLQPKDTGAAGESRETVLANIIQSIIPKIPDNINQEEAQERMRSGDGNPLKIVLMQEIARYNILLT